MDSKSSHIDESGLYEVDSALGDAVNEDLVPPTSETNSLVQPSPLVPAEITAKTVEQLQAPGIDPDKPISEDVKEVDPLQINTGIEQPAITNTVTEDTSAVMNDLPVKEDVPMPENPPLEQPQVLSPAMEVQQLQADID
jgi:hypothetical protein